MQFQPSRRHQGNTFINLYISILDNTAGPLVIALWPLPVLCAGRLTLAGVGDATWPPDPLWICPVGQTAADGRKGAEWGQGVYFSSPAESRPEPKPVCLQSPCFEPRGCNLVTDYRRPWKKRTASFVLILKSQWLILDTCSLRLLIFLNSLASMMLQSDIHVSRWCQMCNSNL